MNSTSVVIANYNGARYLDKCLRSVVNSRLKEKERLEVLVVDDGSEDESVRIIKQWQRKDKRVKLIRLRQNQGPARARNLGVKQAKGKYVVFLDVDTEVSLGAVERLISRLAGDKQIGAVQARLDTRGHFLSWWGFPYEIDQPRKVIFGGRTAGLGIRREMFKEIGGFDEDYVIYGEDTDLCWRVWLAGNRIELVDEAVVKHKGKSSMSQATKQRLFYEGSKDGLSNILKDADKGMIWWMLGLHSLAWLVV